MSIRWGEFKVVYESVTMEALNPEFLSISEDSLRQYLAEHPFPEDSAYSAEDFIGDVTQSSGFYCLPDKINPETADYIADCLQELIL